MSFSKAIYCLIMGPLELLFDTVFTMALRLIHSPGLSLVFLSLAINFLVLPLYKRADALQLEESEQAARLKPGVDKIKKAFKGDDRFMILQTYYRQNNYKPYYVLKGSLSLLLQIPFFIAAYNYLSHLQTIQGVAFGPIQNLGAPDGLIRLGGHCINLLPILMTLINIVSGFIYTKGMPLKSKLQLYGMALVFLVLLYDSPSGLVFYWTLNNIFSLLKNIFNKLRNPKAVLRWMCSILGIALLVCFLWIKPVSIPRKKFIVVMICALLQLPVVLHYTGILKKMSSLAVQETKTSRIIFFASCVILTVLTGLLIPSAVIKASPAEFVEIYHFRSPILYLLNSALLSAGTFLIWSFVFYKTATRKSRYIFSIAFAMLSCAAILNYMAFGKNYGNMSSLLQYDKTITVALKQGIINIAVIVALCVIIFLICVKKPILMQTICLSGCLAIAGMSVMNITAIQSRTRELKALADSMDGSTASFSLDKSGKNVVFIMLDRAINGFIPFCMNERPELQRQFDGFTYYPNTLSHAGHTNCGAPSLYGGYEYTPEAMNARPDVLLKDKHNEALKIMPLNFLEEGYDVTVCDAPLANYSWTSDMSIYNDYPEIHTYNTIGSFTQDKASIMAYSNHVRERNLFCYSIFRAVPVLIHEELYDNGLYNEADAMGGDAVFSEAVQGATPEFLNSYMVLKNLPYITNVQNEGKNTFLSLENEITHCPVALPGPEYEPNSETTDTDYEEAHTVRYTADGRKIDFSESDSYLKRCHYDVNMAALIQLGNWFDYLRENGVYDNTRIIIASDHGFFLDLFGVDLREKYPEMADRFTGGESWWDTMLFNPVLLVKDFNEKGYKTDDSFMTTADVPQIAFSDLLPDPRNPFTGNPINSDMKLEPTQHVVETDFQVETNNGYVFTNPIKLSVHNQNIFDIDNWEIDSIP